MQTQEAGKKAFAPHPGKILFRTMWNNTVKVEKADDVPDANKFVYFDAEHQETHDVASAVTREPIVEVEMRSFDADGNMVEPAKAVRIAVAEFGLHHQELRHSSGPGPAARR